MCLDRILDFKIPEDFLAEWCKPMAGFISLQWMGCQN
jgi:hypothetical protein